MKFQELYNARPIATLEELGDYLDEEYSPKKRSRESLIAYHQRQGHLLRIRRGLYAVVPPGTSAKNCPVDPYLLAAKLTNDSVLAYHTALQVHGKAYSVFDHFFFQSNKELKPTIFRDYHFQCVLFPKALRVNGQQKFATTTVDRAGIDIRVTSLERTLVDVLDRLDLSGGLEEAWRSLESIEYFDLDLVVSYVKLLAKRTTAAKVGFYLEQHQRQLMVEDHYLNTLQKLRPKQPHYLLRGQSGKLSNKWNLIVPRSLIQRQWEEVI